MTESCKNVKIVNVCWKWDMMAAPPCSCLYLFWAITAQLSSLYLRSSVSIILLKPHRHCSHHTSFLYKTLPILIQSKTITPLLASSQTVMWWCQGETNERPPTRVMANQRAGIDQSEARHWPIRGLSFSYWPIRGGDHRGGGRRVPGADQHNQCYQCRDQVLLSTNDLTLPVLTQQSSKLFYYHFK